MNAAGGGWVEMNDRTSDNNQTPISLQIVRQTGLYDLSRGDA